MIAGAEYTPEQDAEMARVAITAGCSMGDVDEALRRVYFASDLIAIEATNVLRAFAKAMRKFGIMNYIVQHQQHKRTARQWSQHRKQPWGKQARKRRRV